jgi:hypothetical protein
VEESSSSLTLTKKEEKNNVENKPVQLKRNYSSELNDVIMLMLQKDQNKVFLLFIIFKLKIRDLSYQKYYNFLL